MKYEGHNEWVSKTKDDTIPLPDKFDPSYHLEAVDASRTNIMYYSFDNFGEDVSRQCILSQPACLVYV